MCGTNDWTSPNQDGGIRMKKLWAAILTGLLGATGVSRAADPEVPVPVAPHTVETTPRISILVTPGSSSGSVALPTKKAAAPELLPAVDDPISFKKSTDGPSDVKAVIPPMPPTIVPAT